MKKRIMSLMLVVTMCVGLMVGCSSSNNSGTASEKETGSEKTADTSKAPDTKDGELLASIKAAGKIVVGTASGYPPYEFVDVTSSNQDVIGIDMEFAQALADEIGVKLEIQDMTFSSLLSSLAAKKIDVAIAGISPTDERKETMDFSDSYLFADQSILILKKDADTYKTLKDFSGKPVAAEKSTTQEKLAQTTLTDSPLTALEKVPDCILELKNGKAAGVVVESIVGEQYVLSDKDLQFSDATFGTKKESAVALNKGNEDLIAIINKVIKDNQDKGNFDKWVEKYSELAAKNAE